MQQRNEIKRAVLEALNRVADGKDFSDVDEDTNVVKELGLETDDGNDLAAILRRFFGIEIPDDVNLLFDESKKKGQKGFERTVGEIIDLVCVLSEKEGKSV